jgi:ribosome-associated protein
MPPGKEVDPIPRTRKAAAKPTADKTPDLLKIVETSLDDDKAEDIVAIDLRGKSTIADYMVIATGRNSRQLAAMASHLDEKLTKAGVARVSVEGKNQGDWVLLDGGNVVVHLFRPEVRTFYALEKMWGAEMPSPERLTAVG